LAKNYLKKLGIYLCGRFGEFEYLNMDACIERGLKVAEEMNLWAKKK
jgi:UDP-galactopyranose mutase